MNNPIFITLIADNTINSFLICYYFSETAQSECSITLDYWMNQWMSIQPNKHLTKKLLCYFYRQHKYTRPSFRFGVTTKLIFIFFSWSLFLCEFISPIHIGKLHKYACNVEWVERWTWSNWNENEHVHHLSFSKIFVLFPLNWKINVTFILMGNDKIYSCL